MQFLLLIQTQHFMYQFQIKGPPAFQWTESLNFLTRHLLWNICRTFIVKNSNAATSIFLDWFSSYFRGWNYIVSLGECFSDRVNMSCRVPQGSVLGPPSFLSVHADDNALSLLHLMIWALLKILSIASWK